MNNNCLFTCFKRKKALIFNTFLTLVLTINTIIDVNAQTIYSTDFNENSFFEKNSQWIKVSGTCSSAEMVVKAAWSQSGTIDIANTTQKSGAVVLSVEKTSSQDEWTAVMSSDFFNPDKGEESWKNHS